MTTKVNTGGLDYDTTKKLAINGDLIPQRVQLSDIDIDNNGQLLISGQRLASEENIQKQLYKIIDLPQSFINRFGKLTDNTTKDALVKMIKSALTLTNVKKQYVTVLGNPKTKLVTNLIAGETSYISNKVAFDIFERIMNQYPALNLHEFDVNADGSFSISLLLKSIMYPNTGNHVWHEEAYNPGINYNKSTFKGINTEFFTSRKVCDNGCIIKGDSQDLSISQLTDESLEKYFAGLQGYESEGFNMPGYGELIQRANHTNISFAELSNARRIILNNSSLTSDEDLKQFLPEFSVEVHKLASKGVDYTNCTDRQLENYPVNHKIWDVVNRLTDFGSHDYGFSANNGSIQAAAGKLLNKKTFDAENIITFNN